MAVLQKDDFALLLKVQHALAQVIKGVGGFRHEVCVHVFVLSGLEGCIVCFRQQFDEFVGPLCEFCVRQSVCVLALCMYSRMKCWHK
jgi:hypothetical protein